MGGGRTIPICLMIRQFCMHRPAVKCESCQTSRCKRRCQICSAGVPFDGCYDKVPTCTPPTRARPRTLTAPSLMTNVNRNIAETTKAAPVLCQVYHQVVFHPYKIEFSPPIIANGARWPALPSDADTALAAHVLTKTAAPNTATTAAIRSGGGLNYARPTDYPNATSRLTSNPDSDVTLEVGSGDGDGDS